MDKVDCMRSDNIHASLVAKKTFLLMPEIEMNSGRACDRRYANKKRV